MTRIAKLCILFALAAGAIGAAGTLFFLTSEAGRDPAPAPPLAGRAAPAPPGDELVTEIEGDRGEPFDPDSPETLSRDMGRLKGRVRSEAGTPVFDAKVSIKRNRGVSRHALLHRVKPIVAGRTNPSGEYMLGPFYAGPGYAIIVEHDDYLPAMIENIFMAGLATTEAPPIVLKKGAAVKGWVRDDHGRPIAGARLALFSTTAHPGEPLAAGEPDRTAVTGADGSYAIPQVAGEAFFLQASAPGCETALVSGPPPSPGTDGTRIDFGLRPARSISGRVMNEWNQPVEGALLAASRDDQPGPPAARAATGPDGAFVLNGLGPDRYTVHASHDQYSAAKKRAVLAGTADLAIRLARRTGISGRVVDPAGAPVANFRLSLNRVPAPGELADAGIHRRYANELGRFVVEGVDPGTYVVQIESARFAATRSRELEVTREAFADAGTITMEIGGVLAGTVLSQDQKPLARATVSLLPGTYRPSRIEPFFGAGLPVTVRPVVTDASGAFAFRNVPAGTYQLEVRHESHPPLRLRDVAVTDRGHTAAGSLVMPAGGTIQGQVYSLTGAAVPGAKVTVLADSGDFTGTVTADLDGRYRVSPVPAGVYTLIPVFPPPESGGVFDLPPPSGDCQVEGVIVGNGDTLTVNLVLYRDQSR